MPGVPAREIGPDTPDAMEDARFPDVVTPCLAILDLVCVLVWEEAFLSCASTPSAVRFIAAFFAFEVRRDFMEDIPKRVRLVRGRVCDAVLTSTTAVLV